MNAIRITALGASLAVLSLAGCERKPDALQTPPDRPPPQQTPQPAPPAAASQFEVPRLSAADLAPLGMGLEMKITSSYSIACNAPQDSSKLATLAAMYYVHGFPQQAATCFRRVAELKPKDAASWYYLGMACQKAGQVAAAQSAYEQALSLGKPYAPALRRLAEVLTTTAPAKAIECYQRALDLNPTDVLAWSGLGQLQIAQAQRDEGLRCILIAANLQPGYAAAQRAAATALRSLGRDAQAEQYERMANAGAGEPAIDDPTADSMLRAGLEPKALCAEALWQSDNGNADRAQYMLEQVRAIHGGENVATEALGMVAASTGKWDEAAKCFAAVIAADPQAFTAKSGLAEALIQQGKPDEAERYLRDVLAQHPEHVPTARRFAALMNQMKKSADLVPIIEAAVAARPFDPVRHDLLSQLYASSGRTDDAEAELRKLLDLRPDYFPGRQQLALLLCGQKKYAEAKTEFERTLQTNPRFEDGYLRLSTAFIQADRDLRAAEKVLRDGLKKLPDSHGLANSLAWVLATSPEASQRKPDEAIQLAERANAATGNTRHDYLDTLAAAYAESGRFDDAARILRQAIEAGNRVNAAEVQDYRTRLALYEQKKPFHEPK